LNRTSNRSRLTEISLMELFWGSCT
jgi:hypothetical protein